MTGARVSALLSLLVHAGLVALAWQRPGNAPLPVTTAPVIEVTLGVAPTPAAPQPQTPPPRAQARPMPPRASTTAAQAVQPTQTSAAPSDSAPVPSDEAPVSAAAASDESPHPVATAATATEAATASEPAGAHNQPYALRAPPPDYPPQARSTGQTGKARVRVLITATGAIGELQLLQSAGSALLDDAALAALRRWRFAPALREGRPVPAWVVVPVVFALH